MEQKTETTTRGKHTLMAEKRSRITLTGVLEVISCDELCLIADTDCGIIVIKGEGLRIGSLNTDKGDMTLEGLIDSVVYEDSLSPKDSFFGRLFR